MIDIIAKLVVGYMIFSAIYIAITSDAEGED